MKLINYSCHHISRHHEPIHGKFSVWGFFFFFLLKYGHENAEMKRNDNVTLHYFINARNFSCESLHVHACLYALTVRICLRSVGNFTQIQIVRILKLTFIWNHALLQRVTLKWRWWRGRRWRWWWWWLFREERVLFEN